LSLARFRDEWLFGDPEARQSVSDPLDRRIGGLEAKSREVDTTLSTHEKGIASADERAKGADQHAADAMKEAKAAQERIGQVDEKATAANAETNKNATEAAWSLLTVV
jgi:hypothetical protein